MKIGVLTSSRADFGIYHPLLKKLWEEPNIEVEIIAFGTHLEKKYGHTIDEIERLGFEVKHQVKTKTENSDPADISFSIGNTIMAFSNFWKCNQFDLVLALGDRYEMFAAVSASSPFGLEIGHIHAGETTLGAIDNAYRHSISSMSKYLFTSTPEYQKRAREISDFPENVFNVGALSVDNLKEQPLFSVDEFLTKFQIDLSMPTILTTFHPETTSLSSNSRYMDEILKAFEVLKERYQLLITMPNADTLGDMIRERILIFAKRNEKVKLVESLGMKGYLSAMRHCAFMIGNTSSGFVEASHFPKWVINLGDRQKGRILTENIIQTPINKEAILTAAETASSKDLPRSIDRYGNGNTATQIVNTLKSLYELG